MVFIQLYMNDHFKPDVMMWVNNTVSSICLFFARHILTGWQCENHFKNRSKSIGPKWQTQREQGGRAGTGLCRQQAAWTLDSPLAAFTPSRRHGGPPLDTAQPPPPLQLLQTDPPGWQGAQLGWAQLRGMLQGVPRVRPHWVHPAQGGGAVQGGAGVCQAFRLPHYHRIRPNYSRR